jgi:hypothetical protein
MLEDLERREARESVDIPSIEQKDKSRQRR